MEWLMTVGRVDVQNSFSKSGRSDQRLTKLKVEVGERQLSKCEPQGW